MSIMKLLISLSVVIFVLSDKNGKEIGFSNGPDGVCEAQLERPTSRTWLYRYDNPTDKTKVEDYNKKYEIKCKLASPEEQEMFHSKWTFEMI